MARLEASALTVAVGDRILCRNLDLALGEGENWAILGANGSGKTTLLHTLAGLREPTSGTVRLDGRAIGGWSSRERARRLGVLFQDYESVLPASVLETVLTGRHPHIARWSFVGEDDYAAARAALDSVELAAFGDRTLETLSGGERRRVELAALLAQDPPILLLDEPGNHLDLRHQHRLLDQLAQRTTRPGHLNLFVLHDVNLALRLASRALLLYADGTHALGKASDLIRPPLLERVYGCPFEELALANRRLCLPR